MPISESPSLPAARLPELTDAEVAQTRAELSAAGVRVLVGSIVDMAGVARAKTCLLYTSDAADE